MEAISFSNSEKADIVHGGCAFSKDKSTLVVIGVVILNLKTTLVIAFLMWILNLSYQQKQNNWVVDNGHAIEIRHVIWNNLRLWSG